MDTIAAQCARRREAAARMEPLEDGYRDPWLRDTEFPYGTPPTILAARKTWTLMRDLGYLDADGWLESVIASTVEARP